MVIRTSVQGAKVTRSAEAAGVTIPEGTNAVYGSSITLITAPTGAQTLVLNADKGAWRVRAGNQTTHTFAAADVNASADTITTTAHGYTTGDGPILFLDGTGTAPAGLTDATTYWIIKVDANTIKLATSYANTVTATAIDITDVGSGTDFTLGSMPAAALPTASITNSTGGIYLAEGARWVGPAPAKLTVRGYASDSALTYYFL